MVTVSCRFRACSFSARNFFFFFSFNEKPRASRQRTAAAAGGGHRAPRHLRRFPGKPGGPCRPPPALPSLLPPCLVIPRPLPPSQGCTETVALPWRGDGGASLRASARAPGGPCAAGNGGKAGSQTAEHAEAFRESRGKATRQSYAVCPRGNKYNLGENPALGRASKRSQPSSILVGGIPTRLKTTSVVRNGITPQIL